jgi:hypothetical protein
VVRVLALVFSGTKQDFLIYTLFYAAATAAFFYYLEKIEGIKSAPGEKRNYAQKNLFCGLFSQALWWREQ